MFRGSKKIYFRYIPIDFSCIMGFFSFMKPKKSYVERESILYTLKVALIVGNKMDLSLMMALIERYPNA